MIALFDNYQPDLRQEERDTDEQKQTLPPLFLFALPFLFLKKKLVKKDPRKTLSPEILPQFTKMLLEVLKTRKNFDLVQAYLASAMKIHRSVFWKKDDESPEMTEILEELSRTQDEAWAELDQLMVKNASVIQWAKNALL